MKTICETNTCTGCRACLNICPKKAIQMVVNAMGEEVAEIDLSKCIHCNLCKKVCPQLNDSNLSEPYICYAAWSLDEKTRWGSASGGVAAELYHWAVRNDMWFSGVRMTSDFVAEHYLTKDIHAIQWFQNSKYVYSNTRNVYKEIVEKLRNKEKVLFIGTPCQVDGLKHFCDRQHVSQNYLFLVDLMCHGSTPAVYLQQHINFIQQKKQYKATSVNFRDPKKGTYTFTFTLSNHGKIFYAKRVYRNDCYQIGYHSGITYRENCYHCKYAQVKRAGDISLADFSYVGTLQKCNYTNKNVSCILVNTVKGENLIEKLHREKKLFIEERPIQEELDYEHMLYAPTVKPAERKIFVDSYLLHGDFEKAMSIASKRIRYRNELKYYLHTEQFRHILSRLLPRSIKNLLRH